jgi:hypothetical protein
MPAEKLYHLAGVRETGIMAGKVAVVCVAERETGECGLIIAEVSLDSGGRVFSPGQVKQANLAPRGLQGGS